MLAFKCIEWGIYRDMPGIQQFWIEQNFVLYCAGQHGEHFMHCLERWHLGFGRCWWEPKLLGPKRPHVQVRGILISSLRTQEWQYSKSIYSICSKHIWICINYFLTWWFIYFYWPCSPKTDTLVLSGPRNNVKLWFVYTESIMCVPFLQQSPPPVPLVYTTRSFLFLVVLYTHVIY